MTTPVDASLTNKEAHRFALGTTGWSVWRWVELRSAGFPARGVLALGSDELVAHIEREEKAASAFRQARISVLECVRRFSNENPAVKKASRSVAKHKDAEDTGISEIDELLRSYREAREILTTLETQSVSLVARERTRTAGEVQRVARDPLFREALTWQNRAALRQAVDKLSEDARDDRKTRQRQRLVASYWQRYTVKNDSIGFFGPVAWGEIDPSVNGLELHPGDHLIKRRIFRFEDWAVRELASTLSELPEARAIIVPRRKSVSWLDGDVLMFPAPTPPRPLSRTDAFLVRAADGARTVADIQRIARAEPSASGLNTDEDTYVALEQLGRQGVLSLDLAVPADLDDPWQWLHERVQTLSDPDARARALAPIATLEAAKDEVIRAAGVPEQLANAIDELERRFHEITGIMSKRGHGKTYAGRLIFYEDCSRDVDITLGPKILDDVSNALTIVMLSARWFTHQIAKHFVREALSAYASLCDELRTTKVPLASFLQRIGKLFPGDQYVISPFIAEAKAQLLSKWGRVLGSDANDATRREVILRSEDLRERANHEFAAPGPGWPRARHHSPDLMIAARDAADVANGKYTAVLGELHCGTNTLFAKFGYRFHPDKEAVKRAWDLDMEHPCIAPVRGTANRASHQPISDADFHVEVSSSRSWKPREKVLIAGDLVVEAAGSRLVVADRHGNSAWDLVGFMDDYLANSSATHFGLRPDAAHLPRVSIDNLVISRERWSYARADFEDLLAAGEDGILRIARWRIRQGLPRCVFGKVPNEPKPFFVDFGSPLLLEIFVRYLQDAQRLVLTEVVPGLSDLWLSDAAGERYTAELRVAGVDPIAWSPDDAWNTDG